ncbi:MAG TPA: prolyl oligopeptidase family serine peptidase, partial [Microlunatus sp.]
MLRYGTWPSPITAESLTEGVLGLGAAAFDGSDLYWLQSSPTDGGRVSLWRRRDGVETELTPAPYDVRSRVHEYGGGAFAVAASTSRPRSEMTRVVFSNFGDGQLFVITDDEPEPRALTAASQLRYGALRVSGDHDLLIAVREDHRDGDHEPVNTVIARRLSDGPEVPDRVLCGGADFYASPELSADGRLAWIEWVHPNMPWDSTRLLSAALPRDAAGRIDLEPRTAEPLAGRLICGGPGESVAVPQWMSDGSLIFVSDRTDWWNLYRYSDETITALCPIEAEFAPPQWALGGQPFVIIDDDRIGCSWNAGNQHHLGVLLLSTGELTELDTGAVAVGSLSCNENQLVTGLGFSDRPNQLVVIDINSGEQGVIRSSSETVLDSGLVSAATQVQWESVHGPVYGWFYPPRNDHYDHDRSGTAGPDGADQVGPEQPAELPPMITVSHGGPTGGSAPVYDPGVQFWTSRGVAVLDVNYGGSTGYGRRYRERLHRRWGVVDVEDCAAGARAMADQGRVDPHRLAIQGSSAGGYTTLRALTVTDVFTAGISRYGIGDLTALVADTHKFES